jgi:LysR family tcuABC transcriptional regulator
MGPHNAAVELRQLRSFIRVVELGSLSRAAQELGQAQSAMSQQISRLEGELATRLLRRTSRGVTATDAGLAFLREAQLAVRHAEQAVLAAQQLRLSGGVSVGLPPTMAAMLGVPLMLSMTQRYPDIRLHLVESLTGHLTMMLNARQLDLAVLSDTADARRWSVTPLLREKLFLIQSRLRPQHALSGPRRLTDLKCVPLILPTESHGLRSTLDAAFSAAHIKPNITAQIDSLPMLMDAVDIGLGCTVQPWAAIGRYPDGAERFQLNEIKDVRAHRLSSLCSLSDDELSPPGLAARNVVLACVAELVDGGQWQGVTLGHHS